MPKRTEDEVVAPKQQKEEAQTEIATGTENVIFDEETLRELGVEKLKAILTIYKVDPDKTDGRNTIVKLMKLVLKAQTEAIAKGGTPTGLENFINGSSTSASLKSARQRAMVDYSIGFTKNMGTFNSLKVQIGITLPVDPTDEELEEAKSTMVVAKSLVSTKLSDDIDELSNTFAAHKGNG